MIYYLSTTKKKDFYLIYMYLNIIYNIFKSKNLLLNKYLSIFIK